MFASFNNPQDDCKFVGKQTSLAGVIATIAGSAHALSHHHAKYPLLRKLETKTEKILPNTNGTNIRASADRTVAQVATPLKDVEPALPSTATFDWNEQGRLIDKDLENNDRNAALRRVEHAIDTLRLTNPYQARHHVEAAMLYAGLLEEAENLLKAEDAYKEALYVIQNNDCALALGEPVILTNLAFNIRRQSKGQSIELIEESKKTFFQAVSLLEDAIKNPQRVSKTTNTRPNQIIVDSGKHNLLSAFVQYAELCKEQRKTSSQTIYLKHGLTKAEEHFGEASEEAKALRAFLCNCLLGRKKYERALSLIQKNLDLTADAKSSVDSKVIGYFAIQSDLLLRMKRSSEAYRVAKQTMKNLNSSEELKESSQGKSWCAHLSRTLGILNLKRGDYSTAYTYFKNAIELLEEEEIIELRSMVQLKHYIAQSLENMAIISCDDEYTKKILREAEDNYQSAITLTTLAQGDYTNEVKKIQVKAHNKYLKFLQQERNRLQDADLEACKIIDLNGEIYGKPSVSYIDAMLNRASMWADFELYGKAEGFYLAALAAAMNLPNKDCEMVLRAYEDLATISLEANAIADALNYAQDSLRYATNMWGTGSRQWADALVGLVNVELNLNKYKDALVHGLQAQPILEELNKSAPVKRLALLYHYLGTIYSEDLSPHNNAQNSAIEYMEKSEQIFEDLRQNQGINYAQLMEDLGLLYEEKYSSSRDAECLEKGIRALKIAEGLLRNFNFHKQQSHLLILEKLIGMLEQSGSDEEDSISHYRELQQTLSNELNDDSKDDDEWTDSDGSDESTDEQ